MSQLPSMPEVFYENSIALYFSTAQVIHLYRAFFLCAIFSAELWELKVLCVDRKFASKMKDNAKKKRMLTVDIKQKIIEKYVCVMELAQQYDRNTSTIIKPKNYIQGI